MYGLLAVIVDAQVIQPAVRRFAQLNALEMARGSGLRLVLEAPALPLLERAGHLARGGFVTGASQRNWASYDSDVELPPAMPDWQRQLLTDPQTSGGLLVSVADADAEKVLGTIRAAGYAAARIVGRTEPGAPGIIVDGLLEPLR